MTQNNDKSKYPFEKLGYSTQGELFIDGVCIKANNNTLIVEPCDKNSSNWLDLQSQESDSSLSESITENEQDSDDISLPKFKGKTVVLVESDEPWYINKDITIPQKYIPSSTPVTETELHYTHGDFKSDFNIDASRPDLGYGYSYASRRGKKCIEGFGDKNDDNSYLFLLLCVLIIVMLIYKTRN
uniref:Uncharacterized protein n=1 Tax=viral metagenome TaxID=1070528 RepID=A0A6C0EFQ2_9ZZZZ